MRLRRFESPMPRTLDALEVREPEDVDQLGASGRRQGLEALGEGGLHLVESHNRKR